MPGNSEECGDGENGGGDGESRSCGGEDGGGGNGSNDIVVAVMVRMVVVARVVLKERGLYSSDGDVVTDSERDSVDRSSDGMCGAVRVGDAVSGVDRGAWQAWTGGFGRHGSRVVGCDRHGD